MALATGELSASQARTISWDRWSVRATVAAAGFNLIVLFARLHGLIYLLYRNPSFLITESNTIFRTPVPTPPPAFGFPSAIGRFGPFTVFIYDHDVAADIGRGAAPAASAQP